jgi:hypothetical protein
MIHIRLATLEDALSLSTRLRAADRDEVIATSGPDIEEALRSSLQGSTLCWVATEDDDVALMIFGVAPVTGYPGFGTPWMLGSDRLDQLSKELLKLSRWYVYLMNRAYPYLINFVDQRNASSIRWLKWCGFKFGATVPEYGEAKVPFIHFYRTIHV